jgi:hypothetical protein
MQSSHPERPSSYVHGSSGVLRLWFGVLGAPVAWAIQLGVVYGAMPYVCGQANWFVLPATVSAAAFAIALVALRIAYRIWRVTGSSHHAEGAAEPGRNRMLALLGLGASGFFAIVIVVQALPLFMLEPCGLASAGGVSR